MKWRRLSIVTIVSLALCSCEYKDLCYDHSHWSDLNVSMDWQKAPKANVQGMTVLFYGQSAGSTPERYDLTGSQGGTVRLLPGSYQGMTYNYDTETILYRGMEAPATLEAYTRQSSIEEGTQLSTRNAMPRATSTEDQPVILEPDPLFGAASELFTLGQNTSSGITLMPEPRYEEITINIRNVPNLQYTGQFGGALSGLAASVNMLTGVPGDELATEAFTVRVTDETTLTMQFRIFGHCPHRQGDSLNSHLLTIYAILADGTQWYYTQDISNQMHRSGATDEDPIELDGLPLPKPIVNGSGFQPTIDGWQGVEIPVEM